MNDQLGKAKCVYEMAPPVADQSVYDYLPAWLGLYIPGLYTQGNVEDPVMRAKLFTPDSGWIWYIAECTDGVCFGYVVGLFPEWGSFSLQELAAIRGPFGLPIERDLWWRPKLASEVISQANHMIQRV